MNIEVRRITNYLPSFITQKSVLAVAVALIAFSVFYIYRMIFRTPALLPLTNKITPKNEGYFTRKNLYALQHKGYLTRVLFRDSLEKQESVAKKMASNLGVPFHPFDGRKLKEASGEFGDLLRRVASGDTPEFIFVSHADEICHPNNPILQTILVHTGSVSQKLLLCLGVSSGTTLPPALASRYRERLFVGEGG